MAKIVIFLDHTNEPIKRVVGGASFDNAESWRDGIVEMVHGEGYHITGIIRHEPHTPTREWPPERKVVDEIVEVLVQMRRGRRA